MMLPSLTSTVYFFTFLGLCTWWSFCRTFDPLLFSCLCVLMAIFSAGHLIMLYLYQFQFFQEAVPPGNTYARWDDSLLPVKELDLMGYEAERWCISSPVDASPPFFKTSRRGRLTKQQSLTCSDSLEYIWLHAGQVNASIYAFARFAHKRFTFRPQS